MKREPKDKDLFDIKRVENRYNSQRRNEVIETDKDYSRGEQSPYRDWKAQAGGYDPIEPETIGEEGNPWAFIPMSVGVEDRWEALKIVYPKLRGRQKEVVDLLLDGETNQTLMAVQLGIDRRALYKVLQVLAKKILKKVTL